MLFDVEQIQPCRGQQTVKLALKALIIIGGEHDPVQVTERVPVVTRPFRPRHIRPVPLDDLGYIPFDHLADDGQNTFAVSNGVCHFKVTNLAHQRMARDNEAKHVRLFDALVNLF